MRKIFATAFLLGITSVFPAQALDLSSIGQSTKPAGNYYPNNGSSLGKFQAAMHIRRDTHLNCFNSVAIGWPIGIIIDNEKGDTGRSNSRQPEAREHLAG